MRRITDQPRQLEVDQAQADLGGGDLGAEHLRPADGDVLEQVGGVAVAAAPVANDGGGVLEQKRVMDKASVFVGIDVSKHRLDVYLRPSGESFAVDYGEEEVAALVERLAALEPMLVVLEATGGLEVRVAAALAAASLPVAVVNPRQVRSFARAMGRLAKTDRLEIPAIAHFAEAI